MRCSVVEMARAGEGLEEAARPDARLNGPGFGEASARSLLPNPALGDG